MLYDFCNVELPVFIAESTPWVTQVWRRRSPARHSVTIVKPHDQKADCGNQTENDSYETGKKKGTQAHVVAWMLLLKYSFFEDFAFFLFNFKFAKSWKFHWFFSRILLVFCATLTFRILKYLLIFQVRNTVLGWRRHSSSLYDWFLVDDLIIAHFYHILAVHFNFILKHKAWKTRPNSFSLIIDKS